jgi:hypothetical protein
MQDLGGFCSMMNQTASKNETGNALTGSTLRENISEPLYDLVFLQIQRVKNMVDNLFSPIDVGLQERLDGR